MRKHPLLWVSLFIPLASLASAQDSQDPELAGPFAAGPVTPRLSPPFRELPLARPFVGPERPARPRRKPPLVKPRPGWDDAASAVDPLAALSLNELGETPSPILNFEGQSNNCGCTPPDPIGAPGMDHYVQMVNATQMAVYDKAGALVSGPTDFRLLWPSGEPCNGSNNGDPVVVYDTLADRFVLAQFSTGNGVCVAVSQTGDPTGAYNLYEFTTPQFPDYFKIGVWPDAYYMSSNEAAYSAYALDRAAMLAGNPATSIRFTGQTNLLLPATVVGPTPPPAGSAGIFYTFKDDSFHGGADRLEFFHFVPDFTTPASSTFTLAATLNIASYTYTVCGFFNFNCIPQGGTGQRVDAVSEWPMWQLQYRNMGGGDERLVANFTVDVGSDRAGIRWYQVNKSGGTYSLGQEGTFAPSDGLHRFMGSIGIDQAGDIALGYSASSANENPSLRYATRAPGDPAGTLQAEVTLVAGGGSQTGSNRWGDYSALTVDPADDCTFWYTGEYYETSSGGGWTTQIGSFQMPDCAPCDITCPADVTLPNDPNQCGAIANYPDPTTSGSCGRVTCTPVSGSFFPVGDTTVTCSSRSGDSCSFTVTVADTQPPAIACRADMTVPNDPGLCSAAVAYPDPAVSDNCPGVGSPVCAPPSGSVFPVGTTPVGCTVADAAGNSAGCGFAVDVNDVEPPVVVCAVASPSLWPPNHNLVNVGLSASATDNCAGPLPIGVGVFGDEDDEMPTGDGNFSPDAKDIAVGTLRLRKERRGDADGRVYLDLEGTTDGSGNSGHACCTVVVPHDQSPGAIASVNAQAAAAKAYCAKNGAPPPGYFVVGDGPIIGPKQ